MSKKKMEYKNMKIRISFKQAQEIINGLSKIFPKIGYKDKIIISKLITDIKRTIEHIVFIQDYFVKNNSQKRGNELQLDSKEKRKEWLEIQNTKIEFEYKKVDFEKLIIPPLKITKFYPLIYPLIEPESFSIPEKASL
jgi:hypothetical protein